MNELARKVVEHLLSWLILLISMPAAYLGLVWLLGLLGHLVPGYDPAIQNHPVLEGVVIIAFFDAALVCNVGMAAQIAGTLLWLLLLVVGRSIARKLIALGCLLCAAGGLYAAKPMCLQKAPAKVSLQLKEPIHYSGRKNTAPSGGRVSSSE